jgi:hypothetical protein
MITNVLWSQTDGTTYAHARSALHPSLVFDSDIAFLAGTGVLRLITLLGEVEGGGLKLGALELQHPLLGSSALVQLIYSHYARSLLPQVLKLIGSSNVLGMTQPSPFSFHEC